ncbi:MAG: serine/threonine protein kinase [Deltaproteobacteria bacterium]|nr:serine/threonine protein kinase [Deltaproteobacteria bacterium]
MRGHQREDRIGRVLDGRYRIDARLAAGGMGVVFRGERLGIGKKVAIKFLYQSAASNPEHLARFEREAVAMSRLTHPNLVSVIDHGLLDGVPYLIMELQTGESLGEVLKRGPLSPRRAVAIARHIVSGMQGIHAAGVIHRDLKPDNVLLVAGLEYDFAKVFDFGVAKLFDEQDFEVTQVGHAVGTPRYMSPEAARCEKVDLRADIYAMGVILFEMITGQRPFVADEDLALLRMHVEDAPRRPRKVGAGKAMSAPLERVILTALEKDPAARHQTASAFAIALRDTPEGWAVDAPAHRGGGVIAALLAIAIGGAAGWLAHDPRVIEWVRETTGR